MGSWGNTDDAANSVYYAPAQFNNTANTTTQAALFGNTTTSAFVTNAKVGQFGVDTAETQALRDGAGTKVAHAGWNLRVEGTGGRAGRVQMETLVAMGSLTGDAEDVIAPDYSLRITTQPSSASGNATANDTKTFTVAARSTPTGATLGYFWQKYNGSAFANLTNAGAYSNVTTATLSVLANTATTGEVYRVGISATGATTIYSSNAVITITT